MRRRRSKYGNIKTESNGLKFDSKGEAVRYEELRLLEKSGHILGLKTQVTFPLEVNGKVVCKYIADFTYEELTEAGTHKAYVVEDFKGKRTAIFNLKAKLFQAIYGYPIRVVYGKGMYRARTKNPKRRDPNFL